MTYPRAHRQLWNVMVTTSGIGTRRQVKVYRYVVLATGEVDAMATLWAVGQLDGKPVEEITAVPRTEDWTLLGITTEDRRRTS